MGGYSSGRYRTRNRGAVEQSLRLDMRHLRQRGMVRPGARTSAIWSWSRAGEHTGSVGVAIDLRDPENRFAELTYSVGGEPRTRRITIEAIPCRYGGSRHYFRCPRSGRRCEVLCCVAGEFAARQHHRLTYFCQSETRLDRLQRAKSKAEARLKGEKGNPRPRGANRKRLLDRWARLEEDWLDLFHAETVRRFGRYLL
jgi:hypothetical protein